MQEKFLSISNLSHKQILEKIIFFCNYRERCSKEVRTKLLSYNLQKPDAEGIIKDLISNDVINDERFANAFARGKFKVNRWGKLKIKIALKQFEINEQVIKKALEIINIDDYKKVIKNLTEKKFLQLKSEKNLFVKKAKVQNFLLQKGFERTLITETLKNL